VQVFAGVVIAGNPPFGFGIARSETEHNSPDSLACLLRDLQQYQRHKDTKASSLLTMMESEP
jgi:hypothetical protein